ncbi:TPA: hypothetical protein ACNQEV_005299, partial [Escherichia coli]
NLDSRAPTRGGKIPSAITGIRKAYCGYCHGVLVSQSTKRNGKIVDGLRRARCGTNNNAGSCITSSFRISIVESAIAEYCSQHFDLSLLAPESNSSKLDLAKYRLELKQLDTKIANYVKFISDGNISPAIISALDEAEKNKKKLQQKIQKSELNTLTKSKSEITAKWKTIKTNLSVYDEENI